MYTTQNKSNKNNHKKAKLPVFNDDRDLQQFLERNLEDLIYKVNNVS